MKKNALFITYTMVQPIVGGAFMRALRLATELSRRDWECTICNFGPELRDPKIDAAPDSVHFVRLDRDRAGHTAGRALEEFRALNPNVVIMGEGPFPAMELFHEAARGLDCPFIVLDQFYNRWLLPSRNGVDLVLLYALASFWGDELNLPPPYEITPPFIEAVTAKRDLPVPANAGDSVWITLVAYDEYVCRRGIELLSLLEDEPVTIVAITADPGKCRDLASDAGLPLDRFVALPLQSDADVFGFFAASAVSIVSNGFLQIMEVLALGCPVIALERGSGVGMNGLNIDARFVPYVSFGETPAEQLARVRTWLDANPFPEELRARLRSERYGCSYCANRIEQLYRSSRAEIPAPPNRFSVNSVWRNALQPWIAGRVRALRLKR